MVVSDWYWSWEAGRSPWSLSPSHQLPCLYTTHRNFCDSCREILYTHVNVWTMLDSPIFTLRKERRINFFITVYLRFRISLGNHLTASANTETVHFYDSTVAQTQAFPECAAQCSIEWTSVSCIHLQDRLLGLWGPSVHAQAVWTEMGEWTSKLDVCPQRPEMPSAHSLTKNVSFSVSALSPKLM